jgi:hypothetical protein
MEKVLFVFAAVGIPLAVFGFLQILRSFSGLFRSGGGDVMAVFLALDLTIIFSPDSFRHAVVTESLRDFLTQVAVIGVIAGALLLMPLCVQFGERRLMEAEMAKQRFPFWPFVLIWGSVVFYMTIHVLFFFGEWS